MGEVRGTGQGAELLMSSDSFQNMSPVLCCVCVCLSHRTRGYDVIVGGGVLLSAALSSFLSRTPALPEIVISASGFMVSRPACVC